MTLYLEALSLTPTLWLNRMPLYHRFWESPVGTMHLVRIWLVRIPRKRMYEHRNRRPV